MRQLVFISLFFVMIGSVCGQSQGKAVTSTIKLKSWPASEDKYAYRIGVMPGWKNGGILWINFPEHLEYSDVGMGISRYSDKLDYAWKLQREDKFAHYEIDSLTAKGVKVKATAKVIEPNKVKFTLKIINNSKDLTLENVKPLLCYQYKTLSGFPQNVDNFQKAVNFKYIYVVIDGQIKALADIPTKNPETIIKGATVKPHPPYRTQFPSKRGGWIDKPLDLALSVVTSEDDKCAVILYGQPGRSMLSNAFIPCLHADPYFGHIKPGETKVGTVTAIFIEGNWRAEVKKILETHRKSQVTTDPRVELGLAAKYSGDKGIESDPNVVFTENFEEGSIAAVADRWDQVQNQSLMSLPTDVPQASSGQNSLLITHVQAETTGAHLYTRLLPGYDELYFRFYTKFDTLCNVIHHFVEMGGYNPPASWPNPQAGTRPNGDDRFMTGIEPYGTSTWYWDFYTYWMEMRGNPNPGTYWGNSFIHDPNFTVPKGQWICVEVMMKMNNPTTERNGELALWVDGQPWFMGGQLVSHLGQGFPEGYYIWNWYPEIGCAECAPFEGFRWRSTEDLKINWVWLLVYISSQEDPGHINKIWFDDIVVAKQYIGPITSKNKKVKIRK